MFLCLVENRYKLHFVDGATGSERLSSPPRDTQLVGYRWGRGLIPGLSDSKVRATLFKCSHRRILNTRVTHIPENTEEPKTALPSVKLLDRLLFYLENS